MAKVITDDKHYKDMAAAIRNRSDINTDIKPEEMAGCVGDVAQHNYYMGETAGYELGIQAERDNFWGEFQDHGNRTNYSYAFAGAGWENNFMPKYDLIVTNAERMFSSWGRAGFDLKAALEEQGVVLDTSRCTNFQFFMQYNSPTVVPTLDTRSCTRLANMFSNASVVTIEKLILRDDGSQTVDNIFPQCAQLTSLVIDGGIGQSGLNVQWASKLTRSSITSIINALSITTDALTVTLSRKAVNNAFETSTGAADGSTSDEWAELIATKPNWTISLV